MIKIEVTGNSIPEVADKLIAIGSSLIAEPEVVKADESILRLAADLKAELETDLAKRGLLGAAVDPIMPEVAEAAPAPEPTPEPTPPASASEPEVSAETLRALVLKLVASKGRETCEEVLSRFGVAKASEIDAERASELAAALEEAL